ncbi:phosphotransferase [Pseudocolwellia sp. AS88]|uniref:phosphotransferase n=1 Tax=Pseudocolwellia sp. AS88 TaxID=3063958 RepID=UPI0026F27D2E|nr:phosphotransferase [Pseudocolwellia sp. AS88]MDO7086418.1 phosphotransferase [Pseudocolwellia sp. AS88]
MLDTINVLIEIKRLLNDETIVFEEEVQSLWSGYGQIIRCRSKSSGNCYIVKVIAPENAGTHPRGWNTSTSHQRKIKSYQVEANFYQHYAHIANTPLINSGLESNCKVPRLFASYTDTSSHCTLLIMEDLDDAGFFARKERADWNSLRVAIRWLAYFHAKFMGNPATNLWQTGTYWHLATRQDELMSMQNSEFKKHAYLIDQALNNASFQTLLHGDAKFENLCFHPSGEQVAAVDFQYIGRGSGVKDLAYLVGSCLDEDKLIEFDGLILDEYLTQLKQALVANNNSLNFDTLAEETTQLYPIAWADFYRFLLGWNPQSWKVCDYLKQKSQIGLNSLLK